MAQDALFRDVTVSVIGGDRRQLEIIDRLTSQKAIVTTYGTPAARDGTPATEAERASSLKEAVRERSIVVLPVPTFLRDETVYAPHFDGEIVFSPEVVEEVAPLAVVATSRVTAAMRRAEDTRGVRLCVFGEDDIMQVHHAIPTAEGAIRITIENTDFTIFGARTLVVGFGRVAQSLARALKGLGASVTVVARREEVRVRAMAEGFACGDPVSLSDLVRVSDLIYNTVPAPLVTAKVLAGVSRDALVIDLASPPGGVDQQAAHALGLKSVWARGQAGSAPRYAGWAQFKVLERFMQQARKEILS